MSAAHWWRAWWHPTMDAVVMATKTRCSKLGCLLHWVDSIIEWDAVQQVWQLVALRSLVMLNLLRLLYAAFSVFHVSRFIFYFRQRRRYMFCSCLSVCLSVCLLARLLKNACMDLDEMLRVDRCRDMDQLINFWARSASYSGCRNQIAFSDIA